jgi:outer membrane lipoprotein LolB
VAKIASNRGWGAAGMMHNAFHYYRGLAIAASKAPQLPMPSQTPNSPSCQALITHHTFNEATPYFDRIHVSSSFYGAICWLTMMLAVLLVGCASSPKMIEPIDVNAAWDSRQAMLLELQRWKMDGRIAVRLENEGWQAGMHWHQQDDHYEMDMFDPLGRKVARLMGGPLGVNLKTSRGESAQAADAESLMRKLLGYSLPVSGLRYWVLGIPEPHSHAQRLALDKFGRLVSLRQSGWDISYQRYKITDSFDLPKKMILINQEVEIKVVVSSWQFTAL